MDDTHEWNEPAGKYWNVVKQGQVGNVSVVSEPCMKKMLLTAANLLLT